MNTKNVFKGKFNKAYSMQFRFLATVIFAIFAITLFVGGLSIYEVDKYVQEQSENFTEVTCENEGTQINSIFSDMEKSVKIMESYIMRFFTSEADILSKDFQKSVVASADEMFVDVANHTSGAVAYYFRLEPSISDSKAGIFYSKLNNSTEYTSLEPTDISLYDKDDVTHVGWFWQPYEAGKPIWMTPYHNMNNNILMISYVIPLYYGERFIGVVGMDFDYMILAERVHGIKIYENGFAHLELDGVVIHDEDEEESEINKEDYLHASKELTNGMTLVVSTSYEDIRQIRHDISIKLLLAVAIVSALFTAVVIVIVKRIVNPLKKLTDASEKLSNGDYDAEIIQSNTHEIKLLSAAFENMKTRLRERERQLQYSANYDSLTGLQNTTAYTAWTADFDKNIKSNSTDFGIAVLDINDLKKANDLYGHKAGDEFIMTAASIISEVFKESRIFRVGGDEFVVILQGDELLNCDELFSRFHSSCEVAFTDEKTKIPLRVALGFTKFDPSCDFCFEDAFKRADNSMYENKRKSKALV